MNEKFLKIIVIVLGILIVLALGFLIYKIATDASEQIAKPKITLEEEEEIDEPYEIITSAPEGHFIVDKDIQDNVLIITFENVENGFIWKLYDINDGSLIGTVRNP